jgi:UDP-N-acetylmuramate--alanine ligase
MRIGIFFGGKSREREISFAGGRTVFDNLNKSMFSPVPIFVDSLGQFIHLRWEFVYKGTIRDFYPPSAFVPEEESHFQLYIESLFKLSDQELRQLAESVGEVIEPKNFSQLIDFAFLALHGPYGEDGAIQGLLEWYGIPYSGSGILPSAIGISKTAQRELFKSMGFSTPKYRILERSEWKSHQNSETLFRELKKEIGLPMVFKAAHQGSSIGVVILSDDNTEAFVSAVNKAFFIKRLYKSEWNTLNSDEKIALVAHLADIREGLSLPMHIGDEKIYSPTQLLNFLNKAFSETENNVLELEAIDGESNILVESFIAGKEFSCIVIEDENGKPFGLPPTEIIKSGNLFDYRSKYLPGMTRKVTPIRAEMAEIERIRRACEKLYQSMAGQVYARIDGFLGDDGNIYLNDPNTTSGMLPSSFFFHQSAEIGLNPSQFLSYIIRTSLKARLQEGKNLHSLTAKLQDLDHQLKSQQSDLQHKTKVAVIMGGFSSERHISVESGRNIFEKLSSSLNYLPIPVFLSGTEAKHELVQIPVNIMLKDNADDILLKIKHFEQEKAHPAMMQIRKEAAGITKLYGSEENLKLRELSYEELAKEVEAVFIALHGRPGEDGAVQEELERVKLPYNGSGVHSSQITINKFETNKLLRQHGILVANHCMVFKQDWDKNKMQVLDEIERDFKYPIIAKPADDGCSSAVKKIKSRAELEAYAEMAFRQMDAFLEYESKVLKLKSNEEFPRKSYFLIEDLITANGAKRFLEITGGLLTSFNGNGQIHYEIFEASEALAQGEVLSLEEKFLAGEGQNITPARYASAAYENQKISDEVKKTFEMVAQILNIQGYARIDAFVRIFDNGKVETIVIEVNSLPGMTPATCIFHQAAINHYKPFDFIDAILKFGISRKQKQALKHD